MKEIWKAVKGYEGYYSVSNTGRVRNDITGAALRPFHSGYSRVRFYYRKPSKSFLVHRLVAQAFILNPGNKPEINHKDFDRANNCVSNLEFCTRTENVNHAFDRRFKGEKCHMAKLKVHDVRSIRAEYIPGKIKLTDLAQKYGTGFSNISAIILRKSWCHV